MAQIKPLTVSLIINEKLMIKIGHQGVHLYQQSLGHLSHDENELENVSNTNLIDGENIARKKKVRCSAKCTFICTIDCARLNPNANFHASFKP